MLKNIILFATADWAEKYWTNKQRMADQFVQNGFRVLYIESFGLRAPGKNKKDIKRLLKRAITSLKPPKKIKENLWVMSPWVVPFWKNKHIAQFNYFLLKIQIKLFCLFHHFKKNNIWTYHPFISPILNALDAKAVYYHVVDHIASVPQVDAVLYNQTEKYFLEKVNALFVTSFSLKNYYESLTSKPIYYSPNVVDVAHFAKARAPQNLPADLQSISQPRILYHGVLSDFKVDFSLLCTLAKERPHWQFIFIGEEREGQQNESLLSLKKLPNVHLLGYRAYHDLPRYLSGIDVGILPLLNNSYTQYMFPMKFFEWLAAGIPVVANPIDALKPYQEYFIAAKTKDEWLNAIEQYLQNRPSTLSVEMLEDQYSWAARMRQVLSVIQ